MPITYFSSLEDADVLELAFLKPQGGARHFRMLVDSGFTGQSWFLLPSTAQDIVHAPAPSSNAMGAIQGVQTRALVLCQLPALGFAAVGIAILSDIGNLALPEGVEGIAGLRFLRQFERWGAERADGKWRFFLESRTAKTGTT